MLNCSFSHIPSVGGATEKKIWLSGVRTMDDFLESPPEFFSLNKQKKIEGHIHESKEKIRRKEARYFYDNLPSTEHWRLFKEYQDAAAYIDIETTGLGDPGDIITTIALYDGKTIKHYINGTNLDEFKEDIQQYQVLITYNGKTFDIPFIERYFGIGIPHSHIDLRYILRSLGYSGGLKSCERQLGIGRTGSLAEVDGFFAVLLWHDYQRKRHEKSLETLLAYNIEDVLNLEYLMIEAYNRKLREIPFSLEPLSLPITPKNPFEIDTATVQRIQNQSYFS